MRIFLKFQDNEWHTRRNAAKLVMPSFSVDNRCVLAHDVLDHYAWQESKLSPGLQEAVSFGVQLYGIAEDSSDSLLRVYRIEMERKMLVELSRLSSLLESQEEFRGSYNPTPQTVAKYLTSHGTFLTEQERSYLSKALTKGYYNAKLYYKSSHNYVRLKQTLYNWAHHNLGNTSMEYCLEVSPKLIKVGSRSNQEKNYLWELVH